jgi:hypothetical protein
MAVDWIKMRVDLRAHPKIVRLATGLNSDRFRVIGGLHAVWCIFDAHSSDGILDGYSPATLDDLIGWPGFSAQMIAVKWLLDDGSSLGIPDFDEHNGKSAKARAQDTKRKKITKSNGENSGSQPDENRTREEKRREDSKPIKTKAKAPAVPTFDPRPDLAAHQVDEQTINDWLALRAKKRAPVTPTVLLQLQREAEVAGMTLDATLALCCVRGWTGFEAAWVLKGDRAAPGSAAKFNPTAHVNRNRGQRP